MSDPVLVQIAEDIKSMDPQIARAREMIAIAKEAGEPVATEEVELREMIVKKDKWVGVLKSRGYQVEAE